MKKKKNEEQIWRRKKFEKKIWLFIFI